MSATAVIDVSDVIERQRRNGVVLRVMILSTIMMCLDGYDLHAMAFAAPSLIRNWGIDKTTLGVVFSAGVFGILVGGLVFGYLGDRIGRRLAIVAATVTFGGFSLLTVWAGDLNTLITLRFLAGIGIGGLAPLCFSLNLEYVPSRYRGTVVSIIMLGYVAGGSAGGLIAAWLVPQFGWPIVFWIGGVLPLIAAVVSFYALPESIKYLVVHGKQPDEVARIVNHIEPGLAATPASRFVVHEEPSPAGSGVLARVTALFDGKLALITPLLWLAYIASSMTMFFLNSWTPILAEASGYTPAQAAFGLSMFSLGGAVGALLAGVVLDRYGVLAIAAVPMIACPLVASLGLAGFSDAGFLLAMMCVGFFVVGGHQGLNSAVGQFYPSANRSTAVGWALSVAKIGSIGGPLIAGLLLARHLPASSLFLLAALPPLVMASCVLTLGLSQRRRTVAAAEPDKVDQAAPA
ncbi:putative hydroxybenzoate transporter; membrane potein [Bradyrhizobium sp. ORS 285]|uniref:MFS transporter n=1 Tax=Bradyrhizobium sp. ORS 285 TaxID=115808 RepID=UPI000240A5BC|nr:MFS transporter [Bradyrhizobium sp. ORS 285]CCD86421.1 putative hydroxybenzoate transporter; membrane potein [Bradyrhizobium sp. ORS 285]SMX58817.1 putative hydroxybenzoate transporter; membrane potein [Bradyrhizobium sp. ORS 285]